MASKLSGRIGSSKKNQFLFCVAIDMVVDSGLLATLSAQKLIYRNTEVLTGDVP